MKAQASLEQLVVIASALAFITIAFYLAANYSADSVKIAQSQDAVERLAAGADHVYALGPNSKDYVTVYLPEDLMGASVTGKRIMFTVPTSGGAATDIFAYSKADLVGSLPNFRGKQKILVEYLPSGKVRIGEAGLDCAPPYITKKYPDDTEIDSSIIISNNEDFDVVNITATPTGAASLVTIGGWPSQLAAGANGSLAVSYNNNILADTGGGAYSVIIDVDSTNGGSCITQITIHVNTNSSCADMCNAQGYLNGFCRTPACSIGEYQYSDNASCSSVPASVCCCMANDELCPLVTYANSTPPNASIANNITVFATCSDASGIANAQLQLGVLNGVGAFDNLSTGTMDATDGEYGNVSENVNRNVGMLGFGTYRAGILCTDNANRTGGMSCNVPYYHYFTVSEGDILGPIITSMNHSDTTPTTLANITEYCTATEEHTGNADITSCFMRIDGGLWKPALPVDGAFDSPNEDCYYNVGMLSSGMHTISAQCFDSLGNDGGIYNDTFGVSAGEVMLIIDKSGSMSEPVTNKYGNNAVSADSSSFEHVKSVTLTAKNGDPVNVSVEMYAGSSGCAAAFEARINSTVVAAGNTTATSYTTLAKSGTLAGFDPPFSVDLYLRNDRATQLYSVGPASGSNFANDNTVGTVSWANPTRAQTSNNLDATATLNNNQASYYLKAYNYDFGAIPSDATITGIAVSVERSATNSNEITDNVVRLVKNGVIVTATNKASGTTWGTSDAVVTYGGQGDLWGTTWTQSDVDSSTSGFVISVANNAAGSSTTANVDYISSTVYYNYTASCTVYNRNFAVTQLPTKMQAAQTAAKTFVDIMSNTTQAGLVSYSTSATTNRQLANMTASAKTTLKSSIDSLSASGNTCTGCGEENGVTELTSIRSRYPNAVRVEVLLTDGQTNVEPPTTTDASANARDNHVTVYTIGFGDSVDPTELTNIAMLTDGLYYYAPDVETLTCIFQHIGQTVQC